LHFSLAIVLRREPQEFVKERIGLGARFERCGFRIHEISECLRKFGEFESGGAWRSRRAFLTALIFRTFSSRARRIACWPASCEAEPEFRHSTGDGE